mgnify:CR=1 FL=1
MSLSGGAEASQTNTSEDIDKLLSSSATQTESLDIDDAGVKKITDDLLSGTGGLAEIFGGEQNAGIFDSSVAAQAAGDLSANIIGEIAKLKAKKTTTTDLEQEEESSRRKKEDSSSVSIGLGT